MTRKQFGMLFGIGVATCHLWRTLPASGRQAASPRAITPEPIYTPDTPANRKLYAVVTRGDAAAQTVGNRYAARQTT
ncbi:MAG: hypothetical protein H7145_21230 [Akkermansiaceae bacterium]|nr:hypothetical protein [Armatimonadota bacterium]